MKKIISTITLVLITYFAFSQSQRDNVIMYTGNGSMIFMKAQNKKKTGTIGSVYMNENWNPGIIRLYSDAEVKNYPFKVDLRSSDIDLKTLDGIKVLELKDIKGFEWVNLGKRESFINCKEIPNCTMKGFFKVIYIGKVSLVEKYRLNIIPSNYNMALDVGNQDNLYDIKKDYYIIEGDKFTKIKPNRWSLLKAFGDKAEQVKKYARKNGLGYRHANDLKHIFEYYNSI